jgi:hypothetical protein
VINDIMDNMIAALEPQREKVRAGEEAEKQKKKKKAEKAAAKQVKKTAEAGKRDAESRRSGRSRCKRKK